MVFARVFSVACDCCEARVDSEVRLVGSTLRVVLDTSDDLLDMFDSGVVCRRGVLQGSWHLGPVSVFAWSDWVWGVYWFGRGRVFVFDEELCDAPRHGDV